MQCEEIIRMLHKSLIDQAVFSKLSLLNDLIKATLISVPIFPRLTAAINLMKCVFDKSISGSENSVQSYPIPMPINKRGKLRIG